MAGQSKAAHATVTRKQGTDKEREKREERGQRKKERGQRKGAFSWFCPLVF